MTPQYEIDPLLANKRFVSINQLYAIDKNDWLGGGTFGNVYLGCRGKKKDKKVPIAVKIIDRKKCDPESNQKINRQLQIMQKLQHKNIIKYWGHEQDKDDKMLFIFIELCQRQHLGMRIDQKIPEESTLKWFRELVDGMAYINSQGYIHRDLKPANLLIDFDNTLKIADFGISRQSCAIRMTSQMGTDQYKAPEILDGGTNYDSKVDVYSAGYVLYEMLTSEQLVEREMERSGQKEMVLVLKIVEQQGWVFDHPAIVDNYFWKKLLENMLKINPQERWSFADVGAYLSQQNIRAYLSGHKPGIVHHPSRALLPNQQQISRDYLQKIHESIDQNQLKLTLCQDVMKMLRQCSDMELTWLPHLYRTILMFLAGCLYCKLNDVLAETINKRKTDLIVGDELYGAVFHKMVGEDKVEATNYLDSVANKLNTKKEQVKAVLLKTTKANMEKVCNAKSGVLGKVSKEMGEMVKIYERYRKYEKVMENSEYLKELAVGEFGKAARKIANSAYLTDGQLYCLHPTELRLFCLVIVFSKIDRDIPHFRALPTYSTLLKKNSSELLTCARSLKQSL